MLHDFSGGRLQHVPGFFFTPADSVEPDEGFSRRAEWSGTGNAAVGDPATRQLAANIRKSVAPGSEYLVLGHFRLGRNAAGGVTSDQADYQGYRADLWPRQQQFVFREADPRSAFVLRCKSGVVRGRRDECFRLAIRPMDHAGTGHVSFGSRLLDDPPFDLGDDPTNTCPGLDL